MSDVKVLLVDDHALVRSGIRAMIETEPGFSVVGEAADGQEGLAAYERHRPDLVLMDIRMPGQDGIEATRSICERHPGASVVVLTAFDGDEYVCQALKAGARAYLQKATTAEQFFTVLHDVHTGRYRLPSNMVAKLAQRATNTELSSREIEVLRHVSRGDSNKEIALHLGISESTVKNHINNILGKMNVRDRTEAVTTGLKRGFIALE